MSITESNGAGLGAAAEDTGEPAGGAALEAARVPLRDLVDETETTAAPGPPLDLAVDASGRIPAAHKIAVSADRTGIVSQAGGMLLTRALRVSGLGKGSRSGAGPGPAISL